MKKTDTLYGIISADPSEMERLSRISNKNSLSSEILQLSKIHYLPTTEKEAHYVASRICNSEFTDTELENIVGGKGVTNKKIKGTAAGECLSGGDGRDTIYGFGGNDVIEGGDGGDSLEGGAGNDSIHGVKGNDWIIGGEGNDTLAGEAGQDTYVFDNNDGYDVIQGFNSLEDKLQFKGASSTDEIASHIENGNTIITYGQTQITLEGVEMNQE